MTTFAVLSDGTEIANPRHFRAAERRLRLIQRNLSRRKSRQKARQDLARMHAHVANQRRDFHHKIAHGLVRRYGLVDVEALNAKGLAGSRIAKSLYDAGWSQFFSILSDKRQKLV